MNAVTEKIVMTALEMDTSISGEQRIHAMNILKYGINPVLAERAGQPSESPKTSIPKLADRPYLRRPEAAQYLGCSVRQIDEMKLSGSLPFYRLGRRLIVFKLQDVEKLMSKHRIDVTRV
jgi:excisionase family DNA binding protein